MKKLRNKKTGEIKSIEEIIRDAFLSNELDSLKSIDTNWEDVDGTRSSLMYETLRIVEKLKPQYVIKVNAAESKDAN